MAMRTVTVQADVPEDRAVRLVLPDDVPVGPAEIVLVISSPGGAKSMTAEEFLHSPYCGMWQDREDIGDSVEFARELRAGWNRVD